MRPRRVVASDETMQIFDQAVRERTLVVVTVQEDDDWQTFKCRFLERDPNYRFFVLDYQPQGEATLPPLVPGQHVGISFRYKSRKVMFSTVVEAKGRYVLDDKTSIGAVRYRWPQTMTELQRRAYFRTIVPDGTSLPVDVWEGGVDARCKAENKELQTFAGEMVDMSCGGCLFKLDGSTAPNWAENVTIGLELKLPDSKPPILVNGHFRNTRLNDNGELCIAAQFVGLELSVDGRVVLQRLATNIQKFHRLGQMKRPSDSRGFGF